MITITLEFLADPQTVQTNIKFDRPITKTELEYFSDVINGLLSVAVDYEHAGEVDADPDGVEAWHDVAEDMEIKAYPYSERTFLRNVDGVRRMRTCFSGRPAQL